MATVSHRLCDVRSTRGPRPYFTPPYRVSAKVIAGHLRAQGFDTLGSVMILAIDIGGTKFSMAVFEGDRMVRRESRATDAGGGRGGGGGRVGGKAGAGRRGGSPGCGGNRAPRMRAAAASGWWRGSGKSPARGGGSFRWSGAASGSAAR